MIKTSHPVRNKIADISSTNNFYPTKGDAIVLADEVLAQYGWTTGDCDLYGDNGRTRVPVCIASPHEPRCPLIEQVADIIYSWYRMPSGNYEITLYLA